MPNARKGKRTYKKKPEDSYISKGAKVAAIAYKGYRLAHTLARFVNTEQKVMITAQDDTATAAAGTVACLNLIGQGDTHILRDGLSIKPSRLTVRYQVKYDAAAAWTGLVRVIIFTYKQEGGVMPTVGGILDNTAPIWLAGKNYVNRFQSKFLYDRSHALSESGNGNAVFTVKLRLEGHINFIDNGATIASVDNGGYYILVITDAGANQPRIAWNARLTYVDN